MRGGNVVHQGESRRREVVTGKKNCRTLQGTNKVSGVTCTTRRGRRCKSIEVRRSQFWKD